MARQLRTRRVRAGLSRGPGGEPNAECFSAYRGPLPGFNGYYLIEADNSIMTSIDLFETSTQASDSTRFAAEWIRDEEAEKRASESAEGDTDGNVVAHKPNGISVA